MRNLLEFKHSWFSSSATFDGKQHLLSLPVVNSVGYVLRFLKKLCRSLLCENLFSDQPIAPSSSPSSSSSFHAEKHSDGQPKSSACSSSFYVTSVLLPFNRAVFTSIPIQSTQHTFYILYIRLFFSLFGFGCFVIWPFYCICTLFCCCQICPSENAEEAFSAS